MVNKKTSIGKLGEDVAAKYLEAKGFKIVERNYRQAWGEIDIVAMSPQKNLVLVEVKTVTGPNPRITAEDQLTKHKLAKFARIAESYANNYLQNKDDSKRWRMDALTIEIAGDRARVKHYENIA